MLEEIKRRLNSENILYIVIDRPEARCVQIKTQEGLVINVWVTTGNLNFQGKRNSKIEDLVLGKNKPKEKFSVLDNLDVLEELAKLTYQISEEHGFNENWNFSEQMMNIHAELSEYWESYRKDTLEEPCDKFPDCELNCEEEEWADVLIRTLNIAVARKIDIKNAIKQKTLYNNTRPYKHGGKKC